MIPRPNNRVVQSGDTVTRQPAVVGAKRQTASVQAHRAIATVAEILGRTPKARPSSILHPPSSPL